MIKKPLKILVYLQIQSKIKIFFKTLELKQKKNWKFRKKNFHVKITKNRKKRRKKRKVFFQRTAHKVTYDLEDVEPPRPSSATALGSNPLGSNPLGSTAIGSKIESGDHPFSSESQGTDM